ncbi:MAG: squalene/phytoene synthase family protein [Rhodospirillaceae bacterium]|jgi:NADH dehydrogenase [ubiquinone] 1 alpha subcomplex assembly factor 6|nr:squalene/phytoene synthase family protein [Rhodospirillaceae bacterium]
MASALSYMAFEARKQDRDRFLCALFAPEEAREGLYTLLAFNAEIAKTREVVSEPLLGEIRLQWWRDALERIYSDPEGDFEDHAVLAGLANIIKHTKLSRDNLDQLIDTRARDMIDEPPEDEAELRTYAVGTAATLNAAWLEILAPADGDQPATVQKASEYVSIAWALTGLLRSSGSLAGYQRIMIPETVMQQFGFDKYAFFKGQPNFEIKAATKHLAELARVEINQARTLMDGKVEKRYLPVFLQATLAELYLKRIEKLDCNPFSSGIEDGRALRQLKLTFKALRGSF